MKKTVTVVFAMVLSWSPLTEAATIVGFTGPYAQWNWEQTPYDLTAFIGEKFTLYRRPSDAFSSVSVTVFETGTITFDWYASGGEGVVNTSISGESEQIGGFLSGIQTVILDVIAGETLTFTNHPKVAAGDSRVVVSNFKAVGIPEPSVLGMVTTVAVGLLGFRRRR